MEDATVGALAVPARAIPAVATAAPVDPSLRRSSAIASPMSPSSPRSMGPTDGRQHRKKVAEGEGLR